MRQRKEGKAPGFGGPENNNRQLIELRLGGRGHGTVAGAVERVSEWGCGWVWVRFLCEGRREFRSSGKGQVLEPSPLVTEY
jgi:hypothetical protein